MEIIKIRCRKTDHQELMSKKQIATNQMSLNLAAKTTMTQKGKMVRLKFQLTMEIVSSLLNGPHLPVKLTKTILKEDRRHLRFLRKYLYNLTGLMPE